jgi:hypothetical protein
MKLGTVHPPFPGRLRRVRRSLLDMTPVTWLALSISLDSLEVNLG